MSQLVVSSSPHIKQPATTSTIMRDVLIALTPAAVASVVIYGTGALILLIVCIASSVLFEMIYQKLMKLPVLVGDFSAAVTGLLLALCLPSDLPPWMAVIGSAAAIIVGKQLFGGLGANFANPAIVGRIVLMLSFGEAMTGNFPLGRTAVDALAGATPLAGGAVTTRELLLGLHGGSLGEVFAIGLILGGLYLIIRKVITISIPVSFLGTMVLLSFVMGVDPIFHLLAGGALLGAFFMATDFVTSPTTEKGKIIYGIGCGLITMAIRVYGSYPEGVSFAILLMNIITPHIDNLTKTKPVGGVTENE